MLIGEGGVTQIAATMTIFVTYFPPVLKSKYGPDSSILPVFYNTTK